MARWPALFLSVVLSVPVGAAEVDLTTDVGVAPGYTSNLYLDSNGGAAVSAPRLSAWAGGAAVSTFGPRFAGFLGLSYDYWVPVGYDTLASHGLTASTGLVWLPTPRLGFDLSPWVMGRLYPGSAQDALLYGVSLTGDHVLGAGLSAFLTGYYVRRESRDDLFDTDTLGGGGGLVWRSPGRAVRAKVEYTLERGSSLLFDSAGGVVPGVEPGAADATFHLVRAKVRLGLGGGLYVQPAYGWTRGRVDTPEAYGVHVLQVALGWRR